MKIKSIVFAFFLFSGLSLAQFPLNDVPLNHPVYSFIENLSTRSRHTFPAISQKPWTREQVRRFLEITRNDSLLLNDLSTAECSRFIEFSIEFGIQDETNKWKQFPVASKIYHRIPFLKWFYRKKWDLFYYNYDKLQFTLNPQMRAVYWRRKDSNGKTELHLSTGYEIRGKYSDHIGFYWNLIDNAFSGDVAILNRDVWKDSGYPFMVRNENSYEWNENIFFMTFQWKNIDFLIGRNFLIWGPGEHDRIILSSNAPAFDQIKLRFTSKYVDYTVVTGKLFAPVDSIRSIKNMPDRPKYLAAQRVDIHPVPFLQIGWTQMIVYANRNFVLGYNLPFSFFKSSEHYYGDRDNGLMAIDFQLFPFRHTTIYFTWLFDDLTTSKIGTDFFGNKFAFQYGLKLFGIPIFNIRTNWFLEYIKIDPYVYSHRFGNITEFKHYDSHLGSFLEPNSDMVYAKNQISLLNNLELQTEFEYIRHGANLPGINIGGSVDTPHQDGDPENVPFLSGIREYTSRLFLTVKWNYFHRSQIFFTYMREKQTGFQTVHHYWAGITFSFGYRPYEPIYRF